MNLFEIAYSSPALGKRSGMNVIVPDGPGPFRVVYQLHGLSDDYTMWMRYSSIERHAEAANVMVVMPDGGRSFYCDEVSGAGNYEQHLLDTVRFIDQTFHTIDSPEGRGIGGLSMGGYGSMKMALKHPDIFGSVAAHSGVLDIQKMFEAHDSPDLPYIFGAAVPPADDCFLLAEQAGKKPAIYFDCGVDDFLLQHNRYFHAHLQKLGIEHTYLEYPGTHCWEYWDIHVPAALRFHFQA